MAKIIPFRPDSQVRQRLRDLETALATEQLGFFILALDTLTRMGEPSPQAVRVLERAQELLREARTKFEGEFT